MPNSAKRFRGNNSSRSGKDPFKNSGVIGDLSWVPSVGEETQGSGIMGADTG